MGFDFLFQSALHPVITLDQVQVIDAAAAKHGCEVNDFTVQIEYFAVKPGEKLGQLHSLRSGRFLKDVPEHGFQSDAGYMPLDAN
jgi:hypothetical protein